MCKKNEKNLSINDIFLLKCDRKQTFTLKSSRVPNIMRIFVRKMKQLQIERLLTT